ncbi:hypothetical protein [Streptomyces axinellae]
MTWTTTHRRTLHRGGPEGRIELRVDDAIGPDGREAAQRSR